MKKILVTVLIAFLTVGIINAQKATKTDKLIKEIATLHKNYKHPVTTEYMKQLHGMNKTELELHLDSLVVAFNMADTVKQKQLENFEKSKNKPSDSDLGGKQTITKGEPCLTTECFVKFIEAVRKDTASDEAQVFLNSTRTLNVPFPANPDKFRIKNILTLGWGYARTTRNGGLKTEFVDMEPGFTKVLTDGKSYFTLGLAPMKRTQDWLEEEKQHQDLENKRVQTYVSQADRGFKNQISSAQAAAATAKKEAEEAKNVALSLEGSINNQNGAIDGLAKQAASNTKKADSLDARLQKIEAFMDSEAGKNLVVLAKEQQKMKVWLELGSVVLIIVLFLVLYLLYSYRSQQNEAAQINSPSPSSSGPTIWQRLFGKNSGASVGKFRLSIFGFLYVWYQRPMQNWWKILLLSIGVLLTMYVGYAGLHKPKYFPFSKNIPFVHTSAADSTSTTVDSTKINY
jgi:hypothetical protein